MHNVTIEFETDQMPRVHDLVRLVLGLQSILSPSISMTYSVWLDEKLISDSPDPTENPAPF